MKHFRLTSLGAAALLLSACQQPIDASGPETAAEETTDNAPVVEATPDRKVVATVNGTPITQDAIDVLAAQRQNASAAADPAALLEQTIALEVMRQEALTKGLGSNPEVMGTLEQQERTVLASAAVKDFIATTSIDDEELRQLYDDKIGQPGSEFKARHILVETEEEARTLITELNGGADFSELAKIHSVGPSGGSGGELGWFSAQQMVAPFSAAAAELEKGTYSKDPVQTEFGWHIIMLDDVRETTPPSFEEVKDRLRSAMIQAKLQEHIETTRGSADIEMMQ